MSIIELVAKQNTSYSSVLIASIMAIAAVAAAAIGAWVARRNENLKTSTARASKFDELLLTSAIKILALEREKMSFATLRDLSLPLLLFIAPNSRKGAALCRQIQELRDGTSNDFEAWRVKFTESLISYINEIQAPIHFEGK